MKLSLVTAVYNEPEIMNTVSSWINYLTNCISISDFEIILCDDFSELSYYKNLEKHFRDNNQVTVLRNKKNEGPGYSFSRCFQPVKYQYTLITDSDGQFPIENLDRILEAFRENSGNDLVFFTHREKKYDNRINIFGQKVSNGLCNFIYKTNLKDFTCAFKFVPTILLQNVYFDARYMNYSLDHTAKLLETEADYIDIPIKCEIKEARKRGILKEVSRAFDRFLYINHLWYRKFLLKRRVLFHHHNE